MYCAHCGEWNTTGSQTCRQCGQALAAAPGKGTPGGRNCPMCMTVNAPTADFCTACGARVILQSGVDEAQLDILRPPAEPAAPLSAAAQIALNLERQREVLAGSDEGPPDPTHRRLAGDPPEQRSRSLFGGSTPAGGNMSWLDSLRDDSPPAAAPKPEPDRDVPRDPTPLAAAPAAASGMPDWLAQLRGVTQTPAADHEDAPAATPAAPTAGAGAGPPAWIGDPAPADPAAAPASANMLPTWLRFAPPPDSAAQADLPAPFPPAEVAAPNEPSGLPLWMDSAAATADGLPAWMNSSPTSAAAPPTTPSMPPEPNGLPAWMDSTPATLTPAANEPSGLPLWMDSAPAAPVAPSTPSEPSGLPLWMDSTPAVPMPVAPNEPSGLPAWMDSAPTTPTPSEPNGLPAWMDSAPAVPVPVAPSTTNEPSGLPLWMDSAPATPTPSEPSGLPAWMDSAPATPTPAANEPSGLPLWMDSAPDAPVAPSTPNESSGLPAWMDSAPDAPAFMPNAERQTPDSEVSGLSDIALPAWLQAAGANAPSPTPPPAHKPLTGKLLPLDDEDEDEAAPPPPSADGILPAWMSGPPPSPPAAPADSLPTWMSGPAPADQAAAPSPQAVPTADGLPAWMSGPTPVLTEEQAASATAPVVDGLPSWMSGPPSAIATPVVGAEQAASTATPVVDGFPSWMSGPPSEPEADTPSARDQSAIRNPQSAIADSGGFLSESDLPAWLRAVQARDHAAPVPEAPPAPQPLEPAADELPAWLRALGGSEDEIDQAVGLAVGSTPPSMVRVIRARPPRTGAVQVFEQLLAAPAEPAPLTVPARNAMLAALTPERIFAVALLAVIGLFVALTPLTPDTVNAPSTAAGAAFYNTLKTVAPTKPVLLVYDWDASRYGEMYELSRAVTAAVVGNGGRFATISTVPEGTGFALNVTASAMPKGTTGINCKAPWDSGAYGSRYLHLGYRPGNEAGLADLINGKVRDAQRYDAVCYRDMSNAPILVAAPSLRDFGAVVLLAGDERPLRMWIEQVGSRLAGATPAVPLLAAMPEGGRPAALPYTGGSGAMLRSAVYGLAGAQEIESLTAGGNAAPNAALGARLHTESAALLTLAGALLLAFIGGAYRWINRRSRS